MEKSEPFTDDIDGWKEGPTLFKKDSSWIVMFDIYNREKFGAMKTRDFKTWENVSDELEYPEGMRHGTVVKADVSLVEALISSD